MCYCVTHEDSCLLLWQLLHNCFLQWIKIFCQMRLWSWPAHQGLTSWSCYLNVSKSYVWAYGPFTLDDNNMNINFMFWTLYYHQTWTVRLATFLSPGLVAELILLDWSFSAQNFLKYHIILTHMFLCNMDNNAKNCIIFHRELGNKLVYSQEML